MIFQTTITDTNCKADTANYSGKQISFESIKEESTSSLQILPTFNQGVFKLYFFQGQKEQNQQQATLQIFNLTGQSIYTQNFEINKDNIQVDCTHLKLAKGVYFIRIKDTSLVKKMIIY